MVRDAYSAGSQAQQADGGTAAQPLDIRGNTANLTQELAQLLAQSIAQAQPGKRPAGAVATGSELASLAALVSASQGQPSQPYKDGLSSLSYARPVQSPVPAPVPAAPGLLVSESHDDEPMPIPSTWRQPAMGDDDRWYRQQLGAAALGLVAGLIVVVPAVLWLSGYLGGPQTNAVARQDTASPSPVTVTEVKTVKVQHIAASADPRPPKVAPPPAAERPVAPVRAASAEPVRSRAEILLAQARRRIESGDIPGARQVLQAPETETSGPMTFMLAETYDPNMLASWQTRGITANPQRARALYQRARDLGYDRAEQRLDWLTVK